MEGRLQAPWSALDQGTTDWRVNVDDVQTMPGMFPIEYEPLTGETPVEIYELPGTAFDETEENVADMKIPVELQTSDIRSSKPPKPPKPSKLSTKDSAKASSKSRKDTKTSGGPSSNDIVIAVFGLTGTGKSSFISKLSGKDLQIGHGLQSCTSEIEEVQCKIGLCNVTLVDTPGFDDTNRSDTEILTLIASWMKDAYDDRTRLTGIIYLQRISDNRMAGSSIKNLSMLRSLCGTKNLSHVIMATTMWDQVTLEQGNNREAELLSTGAFWGTMKRAGSMVRRYDNTKGGAMDMVNELLQMDRIVLQIQEEIAVQKKALGDTKAGQTVNSDLKKLEEKHKEDVEAVRKELAQAVEQSKVYFLSNWSSRYIETTDLLTHVHIEDDEMRRNLEVIEAKLAEQLREVEESKKALRRPINRRAWYQKSWRCKGCSTRLVGDRGFSGKGRCSRCELSQTFI
ncbi:hypothetical protein MMC18_003754 [Xylographa bjoerkii]|nr:hypothetical protein [Xylographa bjoerkii]